MGNSTSAENSKFQQSHAQSPPMRRETDTEADNEQHIRTEAPALQRTVSKSSKAALVVISELEEEYTELQNTFTQLSGVDRSNLEAMHKAKNALAQLLGDIDKFQFNKVSSASLFDWYCTFYSFIIFYLLFAGG